MKYIILFSLLFILTSCSKNKGVYWCGDHACVNKKERISYFKKNMIVEKRVVKKEKKLTKLEIDKIKKKIKDEESVKKLSEKQARKLSKNKEKALIKEEKERLKKAKSDEKRRLKEEKKMLKQAEREKKKKIKQEKKKKKIKSKNTKKSKKKLASEKINVLNNNNDFTKLKNSIIKKNVNREYPDINGIQR